jgi:hypothetical protein
MDADVSKFCGVSNENLQNMSTNFAMPACLPAERNVVEFDIWQFHYSLSRK